jgi:hypothetical protein
LLEGTRGHRVRDNLRKVEEIGLEAAVATLTSFSGAILL